MLFSVYQIQKETLFLKSVFLMLHIITYININIILSIYVVQSPLRIHSS